MKQHSTLVALVFALALSCLSPGCQQIPRDVQAEPADKAHNSSDSYGPPVTLARIANPAVTESSGLVASRLTPGLYWTHNDSGDGPFLYALDANGKSRGVWRVAGAAARDWEDIAAGPGPHPGKPYLYVGDIGDNSSSRADITVYRIPEPTVAGAIQATKAKPQTTATADIIRLRYPDGKHDAEALMVHPATGDVYIITKVAFGNPAIYQARVPLNVSGVTTLRRVGELRVPSLFGGVITGGDISPDGRRVALCDYFEGYELVLPEMSSNFDEIWKQRMSIIDIGKRQQGEAIAYRLDGKALLMTSEGRQSPLIQVERN